MRDKITVEKDHARRAEIKKNGVTEFIAVGGGNMIYVNALVVNEEGMVREVFAARFKYTRGVGAGVTFAKKALEFWGTGTAYVAKRLELGVSPLAMVNPAVMVMNLEALTREEERAAARVVADESRIETVTYVGPA